MGKKSKDAEASATTSSNVYVMDKEFAWIPARLVSQDGDKATVSIPTYSDEASILTDGGKGAKSWREETVSLKHYPGKSLPLQNMKNDALNERQDMVDLPFLHEVRGHSGHLPRRSLASSLNSLTSFSPRRLLFFIT
jgi:hypothetical protein